MASDTLPLESLWHAGVIVLGIVIAFALFLATRRGRRK